MLWVTLGSNGVLRLKSNDLQIYELPFSIKETAEFDSFYLLHTKQNQLISTRNFKDYQVITQTNPSDVGLQNLDGHIYFHSGNFFEAGVFKNIHDYNISKFGFIYSNRFYYSTYKAIKDYPIINKISEGLSTKKFHAWRFNEHVNCMTRMDSILYLALSNRVVKINLNTKGIISEDSIVGRVVDMVVIAGSLYYLSEQGLFELKNNKKSVFNFNQFPLTHPIKLLHKDNSLYIVFSEGLIILNTKTKQFFCDRIIQIDAWKFNPIMNVYLNNRILVLSDNKLYSFAKVPSSNPAAGKITCLFNNMEFGGNVVKCNYGQALRVIARPLVYDNSENKIFIKYRLISNNFSTQWQYSDNTEIILAGLSPGSYTLQIASPSLFNNISRFPIEITQSFFKSQSFIYILLGLIFSIFFLIGLYQLRLTGSKKRLLENKLRMLNISLRPHMIFNYLNGIQSLFLRSETALAETYLGQFNSYLRYSFYNYELEFTYLEDELANAINFLSLEQKRNPSLGYICIGDNAIPTMSFKIPPMLLQPILENAIKHGNTKTGIKIELRVVKHNMEEVELTITDNGKGMLNSDIKKGHGLDTVIQMIKLFNDRTLGNKIDLQIRSTSLSGTTMSLKLFK
jgi:sensor histidine kinase YesM